MRQFEPADSLRNRARKGALLVSEQFAFEKPGGDGGTVHLDEGPLATRAEIMDGARDQFLAGAGFTQNENRRIRRRHGLQLFQDCF